MITSWEMEDALTLIRAIQPDCRQFGYHLSLGGGVLNTGRSEKDLDLYFHPMEGRDFKPDPDGLVRWLTKLWGEPDVIGGDYDDIDDPLPDVKWARKILHQNAPAFIGEVDQVGGQWFDMNGPILEKKKAVEVRPKVRSTGSYRFKLKFVRKSGDRIDVFVM